MPSPTPRRPRTPDTSIAIRRPDPRVWRQALLLADGDPRRIDILDDGTVVVRNRHVR